MKQLWISVGFVFAAAVFFISCGSNGGGGSGGTGDLLPEECTAAYEGDGCAECLDTCCSPCAPGTPCLLWSECMEGCPDHDFDCWMKCDEDHPGGEEQWMDVGECAFDCVWEDICIESDGEGVGFDEL